MKKLNPLGYLGYLCLASFLTIGVSQLRADAIPTGWTCSGNCGSLGANGVVSLSPTGNSSYQYVSTHNGVDGVGTLPTGNIGLETNGSTLSTTIFSATAGTALNFYFNYVTSDGAGYADYAWAELYDSSNDLVSLLFTARTRPDGSITPGFGMPEPNATLTPGTVSIIPGGPEWSALGSSSGSCYNNGCGYTGWVNSNFVIQNAGDYYLKIGVTNWSDRQYDSGLALDGVTIGGKPIDPAPVPEPSTFLLLGSGMAGAFSMARRRLSGR